jgi:hypothetical protein
MSAFFTLEDAEGILQRLDRTAKLRVTDGGLCVLDVGGKSVGEVWTVRRGEDRRLSDVGFEKLKGIVLVLGRTAARASWDAEERAEPKPNIRQWSDLPASDRAFVIATSAVLAVALSGAIVGLVWLAVARSTSAIQ